MHDSTFNSTTLNLKSQISNFKSIETILVITLGLTLIGVWREELYWIYAALLIGITGLLLKSLRLAIAYLWGKIGLYLGYVNSRILLTAVFIFVLLPIALLKKAFSSNEKIILTKRKAGYFTERNHTYCPKDFENPW